MPVLLNFVESFSGDSFLLVGYKNRCELLSEKTGECLRHFPFSPLATITSIVELYDNNKLEILVTHNCKKLTCGFSSSLVEFLFINILCVCLRQRYI